MVGFILAEGPGRSFPAENVDAVFDDGGCDPAPGRRKVSLARPPIGCGLVFLCDAEVLAVLAVSPGPPPVETGAWRGGGAGGAGRPRRGARGRGFATRSVFLTGGGEKGGAGWNPPPRSPLAGAGGGRHFGPVEQGRRLGDPSALRRGPYGNGDRRESSCKKKSGEGDARHGAIVIATWRGSLCLVRPCGRCAHRSAGAADRNAA